jgi:alpha-beta hydrolase superfamily lysophospholipase
LDFDILVPGHGKIGKIGKKEHLRMFRKYLEDLRAAVQASLDKWGQAPYVACEGRRKPQWNLSTA